mgnify:CR=1 FL=1
MCDREKVINYLQSEIYRAEQSVNDIWLECVEVKLLRDALAILKEQESIIESLKADLSETLDVVTNRKNVTHCKDCKHNDDPDYPCERHTICTNAENDENWYCADGQRKEG